MIAVRRRKPASFANRVQCHESYGSPTFLFVSLLRRRGGLSRPWCTKRTTLISRLANETSWAISFVHEGAGRKRSTVRRYFIHLGSILYMTLLREVHEQSGKQLSLDSYLRVELFSVSLAKKKTLSVTTTAALSSGLRSRFEPWKNAASSF